MRIIINNVYQPLLEGSSVNIKRTMSDPIPTCQLILVDNNASLAVQEMAEIIVIDDQVYANPTLNTVHNPTLNPYTDGNWNINTITGITLSQNGGGGVIFTMNNAAVQASLVLESDGALISAIVPGQSYVASVYIQAGNTLSNTQAILSITWYDSGYNLLSEKRNTITPTTTNTRYSLTAVAPANANIMQINFGVNVTNATNTGIITWTNAQLEPLWFSSISYPTPFCGPSQTHSQQLPNAQWIRQYRKFAGFVNHVTYGNYRGNVRDVQISAVGYSWLMSTVIVNDSFANHHGDYIFDHLCSTYLRTSPNFVFGNAALFNTTTGASSNIQQGILFTSIQSNWDDLHTIFNSVAGSNGWYWTVDYYWSVIFLPPGFFSMLISLICDNSSQPDMATTFPAYDFSAEMDFTQPGGTALVIGATVSNVVQVAEVINPSVAANYGFLPQYTFMRKINESYLQSTADCTQRGVAELLLYGGPRWIYHLKTNVELNAGYGIQLTSATEGLSAAILLIQSVSAKWLGTNETLTDLWEYQADLGALNHAAINILSRIFRTTKQNTTAPAIQTVSWLVSESLSIADKAVTGTTATGYAATVLGAGAIAYYRLDELIGTIADDISGSAFGGTLHGTITLNQSGALHSGSGNASMLFDGSTGYISLNSGLSPNSWTAFSVEAWINMASTPTTKDPRIIDNSKTDVDFHGFELLVNRTTTTVTLKIGNGATSAAATTTSGLSTGTWSYIAATFDGSNIRIYFNGSLQATTAFSASINNSSNVCTIGANVTGPDNFINAYLQEVAVYHSVLSGTQIGNHYTAGTT